MLPVTLIRIFGSNSFTCSDMKASCVFEEGQPSRGGRNDLAGTVGPVWTHLDRFASVWIVWGSDVADTFEPAWTL